MVGLRPHLTGLLLLPGPILYYFSSCILHSGHTGLLIVTWTHQVFSCLRILNLLFPLLLDVHLARSLFPLHITGELSFPWPSYFKLSSASTPSSQHFLFPFLILSSSFHVALCVTYSGYCLILPVESVLFESRNSSMLFTHGSILSVLTVPGTE